MRFRHSGGGRITKGSSSRNIKQGWVRHLSERFRLQPSVVMSDERLLCRITGFRGVAGRDLWDEGDVWDEGGMSEAELRVIKKMNVVRRKSKQEGTDRQCEVGCEIDCGFPFPAFLLRRRAG